MMTIFSLRDFVSLSMICGVLLQWTDSLTQLSMLVTARLRNTAGGGQIMPKMAIFINIFILYHQFLSHKRVFGAFVNI